MSQNDRCALEIMESTVKPSNGHYEIGLPWKNEPPCYLVCIVPAASDFATYNRK